MIAKVLSTNQRRYRYMPGPFNVKNGKTYKALGITVIFLEVPGLNIVILSF